MFTWEIMSSLFKNPNHVLFKDPVVIMKEIMSWLFKDPINSGLDHFGHAQWNSKKWPKAWKDQTDTFVINIFFWYKPLLLLSSTYWPFSLCKI